MRDQGMFESALHRSQNLAAYGQPDVAALATSSGYGLARDPTVVDAGSRSKKTV